VSWQLQKPTRIVVSCDPEFYRGRPVEKEECRVCTSAAMKPVRPTARVSRNLSITAELRFVKLEFHGTDTDTDTDFRDAPIVQFFKRVHDSLSCTVHAYMYTRAHP